MANYTKISKRVSGPGVKRKSVRAGMGVTKAPKGVASMGKLMSQGMSTAAAENLMRKARELKPSGRINMDDLFNADKYKMKMPQRAPMQKGPLGPLRPVRERSQSSRLIRTNARRPKR